jgi:ERCC4-type nuclease
MNSVDGILEADPNDIAEIAGIDLEQAQKIQESAKKEHERKLASA